MCGIDFKWARTEQEGLSGDARTGRESTGDAESPVAEERPDQRPGFLGPPRVNGLRPSSRGADRGEERVSGR